MTTPQYDWDEWREANRAMWDERVPIHTESKFYDLAGFIAGKDTVAGLQADEVGDVTGKRLVHLQCHIGHDTLSWAKRGAAKVVGLDFSAPAVEAARDLAAKVGLGDRAEFVTADVYDAPSAVPDADYDIVYTGIGALCWLNDIERWAESAAALVAPGGFLYVYEFHPLCNVLDFKTGTVIERDYIDAAPIVWDEPGTYTDGGHETVNNRSFEGTHTLGAIVSALAAQGLRIEFLHEFDRTHFQQFESLENRGDGFRWPEGSPRTPLMYSIKASRPA